MSGAVIIGAGPGIGQAVARRFAREGLPITLIARGGQTLRAVAGEVARNAASHGVPIVTLQADSTDRAAVGRGPRPGHRRARRAGGRRVQRRARPRGRTG
ncbi:SDR family NAD(P)-dependent oxidoreductase [Streptomyces sp. GLT-R25]